MKKILLITFVLVYCMLLLFSSASAEERSNKPHMDYESAMWAAVYHWDGLERKYDDQLTNQQRFVARYYFTDAIQYAREGNWAMIDAINACDSLDDFVAILNNGVIDPNNPCVPEPEIIEHIYAILKAAGYQQPECIYVLHINSDNHGHSWHVQCGYLGLRSYENGDEFVEPFIEYKLVLEGEDHCLTMFADTAIIVDDVISIQY